MDVPETRYARVNGLRIAFQEFGSGPPMLLVPPLITNIDVAWEHEFYRRMLEHIGSFLTVVHFDKRGIGLSDRFEEPPTLDQRIADIAAVMDAVGWESANLLGASEGGAMAQHFAVECPQRVEGLALVNAPAPAADGDLIRESSGDRHRSSSEILADWLPVADSWGEDATAAARLLSPSQLDNESYLRWMNRYHRLAASPADFQRQLSSVVGLSADLRPDRIEAPTIVVQLRDDRVIPVGNGRVLAGRIPDAQLVEVDGGDHFAISQGNWREVFDPIITFFTGTRPPVSVTRRFAAVMFTDIVNSTALASSMGDVRWLEVIGDHDRLAHRVIAEQAGRVIKSTGDGVLAIFDAPSSAIAVATRLRDELAEHGLTIRVGVHAGEIEEHPDGDISGVAVNLAARVEQAAPDGSIIVSSTMKDMLLGTGTTFEDRGPHELKGVGGRWNLYEVA